MRHLRTPCHLLLAALLAASCTDHDLATAPLSAGAALFSISDGAHDGTAGFHFLPPMARSTVWAGDFDATLQPIVEVCAPAGCAALHARFSMTDGEGSQVVRLVEADEHYIVNWHTGHTGAVAGQTYRVRVLVGDVVLGHADVSVVSSGGDAAAARAAGAVAVVVGQTLPVKLRIETGIVGAVLVTPGEATTDVGGTQQFTAALRDLHGAPLAGPTITWSSGDAAIATLAANGLATGVTPGTTSITATAGPAMGSALLHVNAASSVQGFAYVAHTSGTISVINATHAVVGSIPDAALAHEIAITPDGTRAYVTHSGSATTVSVINTVTNTLIGSIVVGQRPLGIAMSADGSLVYVASEVTRSVSVISTATNTVVATIPTSLSGAASLALNPSGTHLLVGGCGSSQLALISTATNTIEKTIPVPSGCTSGIVFRQNGSQAYVANGGSLLVVNTVTNALQTVLTGLPSCGGAALALMPDESHIYVAAPGHPNCGVASLVRVISTATHTVTGTIAVGAGPTGIAITADGGHAWVTGRYSNSVSIIRTADNAVVSTIGVGSGPTGIALR